jgi:hypothetical protein
MRTKEMTPNSLRDDPKRGERMTAEAAGVYRDTQSQNPRTLHEKAINFDEPL